MSNSIQSIIKATKPSFLSKTVNLDFGTEAHFAMQQLSKNSFITGVALKNQASVQSAMINVAAIGLSLNPAHKEAYLVPRDNAIHLDVSYTGLIHLATNTGSIKWVQAKVVYENDEFLDNGVGIAPSHVSDPFADRGDAVGVYCVAKTLDGDYLTTTMSAEEIEAVRQTSKAAMSEKGGKFSPWSTFPAEMWKKTVIKRAAKTWPKTDQAGTEVLQEAIHVINEHEGNVFDAVTSEQTDIYASLVEGSDDLALYVFFQDLEIEQRIQLQSEYVRKHAPDRQKGAFTKDIEDKLASGRVIANDYSNRFAEANNAKDQSGYDELKAELEENEYDFIKTL